MAAHFRHGHDIEDLEVLARLGAEAGLDPEAAAASADDGEYLGRVDGLRDEAAGAGVTGIPTLIFGQGGPVVVGCQPLPELANAAERAGANKRATS
jgi:predicted DsbA family dithiol-disulfide isomerase